MIEQAEQKSSAVLHELVKEIAVNLHHKLLITIVKKGRASKIVQATKKQGAEGGTIVYGKGVGIHEKSRWLGLPVESEKEIILTLVPEDNLDCVLQCICETGELTKKGTGISVVIDIKQVGGICHRVECIKRHGEVSQAAKQQKIEQSIQETEARKDGVGMEHKVKFDMIISIVNKGHSDRVVEASKEAGAEGGTILHGRGTGIHEHAKLFSIQIEPEKEIVLTLVPETITDQVLQAILEKAELQKPGKGIAFVMPVDATRGINHLVKGEDLA